MKLEAGQRLLSERTNQEKITHYKRALEAIKHRLHVIDPEKAPITTRKLLKRAVRLEMRVQDLLSRHKH